MWICAVDRVFLLKSRDWVSIRDWSDEPHHQEEKDMDSVDRRDAFSCSLFCSSIVEMPNNSRIDDLYKTLDL